MVVDPSEIWPPNHKMVTVVHGASAADETCLGDFSINVTSNESINGPGDGNTDTDWNVIDNGDGTYDVEVRAERAGRGNGRLYTITAVATDCAGNQRSEIGTAAVPKSH
jgi:endo-1,4-beta-xylanase